MNATITRPHFYPAVTALVMLVAASAAPAAERKFAVAGFDSVRISDIDAVDIVTGGSTAVVASGDSAELDRLDVNVVGGVLEVAPRGGAAIVAPPVRARLRIAVPMINHLAVRGGGTAHVNRVAAPGFTASLAGPGRIDIAVVDSQSAAFSTSGSGSISAAGRCDNARAMSTGSGLIDLSRLACAALIADTGGSGDISARASATAKLTITGAGNISVSGGAKCTVSAIGSGKAICS